MIQRRLENVASCGAPRATASRPRRAPHR